MVPPWAKGATSSWLLRPGVPNFLCGEHFSKVFPAEFVLPCPALESASCPGSPGLESGGSQCQSLAEPLGQTLSWGLFCFPQQLGPQPTEGMGPKGRVRRMEGTVTWESERSTQRGGHRAAPGHRALSRQGH